MRTSHQLGFFTLALVWGSDWLLGAMLPGVPPLAVLALRYGLASLLLLPSVLRQRNRPTWRALVVGAAAGACFLCLPQWLLFLSVPHLPGGYAALALASVPVWLAAAGRLPLSTALCGFAGVLFLTGAALEISMRELPWLLCALAAAALLAAGLVLAERQLPSMSASALLWSGVTPSSVVLAFASHTAGETLVWSANLIATATIGALVLTMGGYLLFFRLLRPLGAGRLSTLAWAQLLVATAESALIQQIRPTWEAGLGAVLIVAALVLAMRRDASDSGTGLMLQMTAQ